MYRSYSVNDMPRPVTSKPVIPSPSVTVPQKQSNMPQIIKGINDDDLILILVIFILLMCNCDDKLLLIALIYVFLSGYMEK